MRLPVLLVLAALGLSGCANMVFSEKPLFTAGDAPEFRPGVWSVEPLGDCKVDLRRPVQNWPTCAEGLVYDRKGPIVPPDDVRLLLVAGDPLVLQMAFREGASYAGVQPLAWDRSRRIQALEIWVALCGPPAPPKAGEPRETVTEHLLPGLIAADDVCLAKEQAAVRRSVAASRAWAREPHRHRWVREATPADESPVGGVLERAPALRR